mmetsp:Transcript_11438/g.37557  ORF Transcript_11438/g.37557 Transcript_11438/m.37557 type:complete len:305 (-) Transcript_11438:194-1108(-)
MRCGWQAFVYNFETMAAAVLRRDGHDVIHHRVDPPTPGVTIKHDHVKRVDRLVLDEVGGDGKEDGRKVARVDERFAELPVQVEAVVKGEVDEARGGDPRRDGKVIPRSASGVGADADEGPLRSEERAPHGAVRSRRNCGAGDAELPLLHERVRNLNLRARISPLCDPHHARALVLRDPAVAAVVDAHHRRRRLALVEPAAVLLCVRVVARGVDAPHREPLGRGRVVPEPLELLHPLLERPNVAAHALLCELEPALPGRLREPLRLARVAAHRSLQRHPNLARRWVLAHAVRAADERGGTVGALQ